MGTDANRIQLMPPLGSGMELLGIDVQHADDCFSHVFLGHKLLKCDGYCLQQCHQRPKDAMTPNPEESRNVDPRFAPLHPDLIT